MSTTTLKPVLQDYEHAVAKIVLHAVQELPFSLGMNKLLSLLRGSKSSFVIEYKLYELESFCSLSHFSRPQLVVVIQFLIKDEFLEVASDAETGNRPVIKLTEKGVQFLEGQTNEKDQFLVPFLNELMDKEIPHLEPEEQEVFEKLRQLRKSMATEKKLPPYCICQDEVLRGIAIAKPTNIAALAGVKGVGDRFASEYGEKFLNEITA